MIFYFVMVALAMVYAGGSFFDLNFGISLFLAGMGSAMMALVFASQARLLQNVTRNRTAAEYYRLYLDATRAENDNWNDQ